MNQTDKQTLWLCIHFANLPLDILGRDAMKISENNQDAAQDISQGTAQGTAQGVAKDTTDRPIVVLERQRVTFLNDQARALNIQTGSSMDTAYTLSSQVLAIDRNPEKETQTLNQLAQWAYQFTPQVVMKPPVSLLLNITGCLKLFKGIKRLKHTILSRLNQMGYSPEASISYTPLSALMMAKAGHQGLNTLDNFESVSWIKEALADIPLAYMEADKAVVEGLQQMGISTMSGLLQLPIDGITRRYDKPFSDYLQRLSGTLPDPQAYIDPTPHFLSELNFLSDVDNLQSLIFPIRRLLDELCQFLRGRQLTINQCDFLLSHRSHGSQSFSLHLAQADSDPQMLLSLTQLELDRLKQRERVIPEVDSLTLIANHFLAARRRSNDLFQGTRFEQKDGRQSRRDLDEKANLLMNQIRARLGPGRCFGIDVNNDHRPEKAWRWIPIDQSLKKTGHDIAGVIRPMSLLSRPRHLANRPSGQPVSSQDITCHIGTKAGKRYELLQGPERIDTGWWDTESDSVAYPARDYYIARHTDGSLCWLFYSDDNWYLHGLFS